MLAALADGVSRIDGFLEGEDTRATAAVFAQLGVRIEAPGCRRAHRAWRRHRRPARADRTLDCGNAGTAMRLLAGLLAGQAFDSMLVGDASLSQAADAPGDRAAVAHGRAHRLVRWPAAVADRRRAAPARHRLRAAGRQRAGEVGAAARRPVWRTARRACANRIRRATTPSACCARSVPISISSRESRACVADSACARPMSSCPTRFLVGRVLHRGGDAGARFGTAPAPGRHESAPHRPAARIAGDGRGHRRGGQRRWRAANPWPISSCAMRRCTGSKCRSMSCRT